MTPEHETDADASPAAGWRRFVVRASRATRSPLGLIGTITGVLIAGIVGVVLWGELSSSDDLLRRTTYERGDEPIEAAHTSTSHGITLTDEVALMGSQAGVALLQPGDPQWNGDLGFRAEWHGVDHAPLNVERWHGINYYLPDDWHQGDNDATFSSRIVFQFHTSGGPGWSPIYGILVRGDPDNPTWAFYRKDRRERDNGSVGFPEVVLWDEPAQVGEWINLVIHVMWTTDETGFIELYRDGVLTYGEYGIRTMNDEAATSGPYSKWGIYGQPTRILFDEIRIAEGPDQLEAVMPELPTAG